MQTWSRNTCLSTYQLCLLPLLWTQYMPTPYWPLDLRKALCIADDMASNLGVSQSTSLQLAIETYCTKYGAAGWSISRQCSLQELFEDVARLEQERKGSRIAGGSNIRTRVIGLITFVERYAPAIDCLVQTGSGSVINPAALVWGLVRVLLEVRYPLYNDGPSIVYFACLPAKACSR